MSRKFAIAVLLLLFSAFWALNAYAQTATEIQNQIDESAAQIAELKTEIAELQAELDVTVEKKQTLETAVSGLNLNIQKLTKSISLTNAEINQKDLEIQTLSGSILTTSERVDLSRKEIGNSLRELDTLDTQSLAVSLLGGSTLSELFDQAATLAALRTELEGHMHELSNFKENLEVNKDAAETKRAELTTLRRQLDEEKQGLAVARDEQNKLLKETQNRESSYQTLIAQKRAEQAKFEAALFELSSQLEYVLDPTRIPSAGSAVLRWPLDSVFITQQFGKTVDSARLYTSGTHDGIDLRANIGMPVRAALSGRVIEINQGAVPYCQYGKWVLIEHGNGLTTLYAHLSNISVGKGQAVSTSEVVGFAGNTGYATGPHLHFTVYISDAVSLKQYTCKSGYTVTIPIAAPNAYLNPLSYLPAL